MKRNWLSVWALAFSALAPGCGDATGPTADLIDELKGGLVFGVVESRSPPPDGPELTLIVQTKEDFGCSGYKIAHEFETSGTEWTYVAQGIEPLHGCFSIAGPALSRHSIEDPTGARLLTFRAGNLTDQYLLEIEDDAIRIQLVDEPSFTRADRGLKWRFPPHSFALGCDRPEGVPVECAQVFGLVEDQFAATPIDFGAEGLNPYWEYVYSNTGSSWRYYAMADDESIAELADAVCAFVNGDNRPHVLITDWIGRTTFNGPSCGL